MYYRIRIIHTDNTVTVRDYAFSQVSKLFLSQMTSEQKVQFDVEMIPVILPSGEDVKLVGFY